MINIIDEKWFQDFNNVLFDYINRTKKMINFIDNNIDKLKKYGESNFVNIFPEIMKNINKTIDFTNPNDLLILKDAIIFILIRELNKKNKN